MNNIDILEEKENIKLEDKYKQTLKMAKEVMEDVCERNNGCEPSKSECLAYNMQYVKKYVETLIEENKELKEKNKELEEEDVKIRAKFILQLDNYIPKSKVEEKIEELENIKLCSDEFFKVITENKIKLLQSLLGKE